ncbi:uncharacterized protein LOC122042287 [Zingiber officinale]|uniref:GIR1-like zinc ribbon domain-containing protein n=1 Tax=Zingiber officinale TaxID=94328 RepID=A0A8J5HKI6_ZINOF|nr:uncharacterized protein LOC122042287 [Zingiber officinale]KAG6529228.1 hypothetical protein ZIOFF_011424 [Zingiber officinale]
MVAELISLAPVAETYQEESETKTELVTLDLLGGRGDPDRAALDLELQVTAGWARRLVPLSAKLYLSPPSPPSLGFLGLKQPPAANTASASAVPGSYRSVCTLEKVKSALARESLANKRSPPSPSSSSSSYASASASATTITASSFSAKRLKEADKEDGHPRAMAVAACPECLLYVLICKSDPWCPRCAAHVPVHGLKKKPRLDLNFSFQACNQSN